jgi:hypothetical protein
MGRAIARLSELDDKDTRSAAEGEEEQAIGAKLDSLADVLLRLEPVTNRVALAQLAVIVARLDHGEPDLNYLADVLTPAAARARTWMVGASELDPALAVVVSYFRPAAMIGEEGAGRALGP